MRYPPEGLSLPAGTPVQDERAIERLTAGQRDCLHLVAQLQSSKQIARQLGISSHTVDQRLARACRILGASTRADAALMLARSEAADPSEASISDRVPLAGRPDDPPAFPQLGKDRSDQGELHVAGPAPVAVARPGRARLPFPTADAPINDMSFRRKLAWAAAICAAAVVVVGILLQSLAALRTLS